MKSSLTKILDIFKPTSNGGIPYDSLSDSFKKRIDSIENECSEMNEAIVG